MSSCDHKWEYMFGINAIPHCIRVYDCKICGAEKQIKTPQYKSGKFGKGEIKIKKKEVEGE